MVCAGTFTIVDVNGLNPLRPLVYILSLYLPKVRLTPTSPWRTTVQDDIKKTTVEKKTSDFKYALFIVELI
jgi:hypothetical protein